MIETYDCRDNPIAQEEYFKSLDKYDQEKVVFLIRECGYSLEKAFDGIEDIIFYEGLTLEELAGELVETGHFGNVDKSLYPFINFKALARALALDHYYETNKGTFYFC